MRRRVSYFWAFHVNRGIRLSDAASDGLDYALQLAEDAKLRAEHVLEHRPLFPPLTIQEVAEISGVSPVTVRRRIALARKELFGDLTDSGIYYRLRRKQQLQQRKPRTCQQQSCDNPIPQDASAARRYCDEHRTPAARVKRYRGT